MHRKTRNAVDLYLTTGAEVTPLLAGYLYLKRTITLDRLNLIYCYKIP